MILWSTSNSYAWGCLNAGLSNLLIILFPVVTEGMIASSFRPWFTMQLNMWNSFCQSAGSCKRGCSEVPSVNPQESTSHMELVLGSMFILELSLSLENLSAPKLTPSHHFGFLQHLFGRLGQSTQLWAEDMRPFRPRNRSPFCERFWRVVRSSLLTLKPRPTAWCRSAPASWRCWQPAISSRSSPSGGVE